MSLAAQPLADPRELSLWDTHTVSLLPPAQTQRPKRSATPTVTAGPDTQLPSILGQSGSVKKRPTESHTHSVWS